MESGKIPKTYISDYCIKFLINSQKPIIKIKKQILNRPTNGYFTKEDKRMANNNWNICNIIDNEGNVIT